MIWPTGSSSRGNRPTPRLAYRSRSSEQRWGAVAWRMRVAASVAGSSRRRRHPMAAIPGGADSANPVVVRVASDSGRTLRRRITSRREMKAILADRHRRIGPWRTPGRLPPAVEATDGKGSATQALRLHPRQGIARRASLRGTLAGRLRATAHRVGTVEAIRGATALRRHGAIALRVTALRATTLRATALPGITALPHRITADRAIARREAVAEAAAIIPRPAAEAVIRPAGVAVAATAEAAEDITAKQD